MGRRRGGELMSRTYRHVRGKKVSDLPYWLARKHYSKISKCGSHDCSHCLYEAKKPRARRIREAFKYESLAG